MTLALAIDRALSRVWRAILDNLVACEVLGGVLAIFLAASYFTPGLVPDWLASAVKIIAFLAIPVIVFLLAVIFVLRLVLGFLDSRGRNNAVPDSELMDDAGRD